MVWIDRPQRGLAFYNVRGCPAVHCIESSGDSWISYADTLPNKKALERVTANYWKRRHLLPPTEITSDCRTDVFSRQRQLVSFHGCNICIVNDNHWQTLRNKSTTPTLYIDYLYLCKGYDGRLKELTKFFLPVVSSSMPPSQSIVETVLRRNARNTVYVLSPYRKKVLSAFCSKYKELSYICTLIKKKSMLTKVIEQAKIDHFTKWFERADKIVIVSHVSPDGDAIGSSLGLYHFLDSQEKTVNVIVPNAFPDFLKWMPGSKDILLYDRYKEFADKLLAEADVICCLDFNALKRIEDMADAVAASPARKILIDHHLYPEDFCKITMSYPKISSTSELVFRLICRMGYFDDISKEGAECIYTGMMTDTGGFTYNSNNREIYFIISELLSKGIDKDDIYRKVYNTYSESRLRLMGYVLSNMTVYSDCNSALITLTKAEQSKFHYIKGDSEGFVNIPLSIKNVRFSCFLREDTEKPMIKISLRSVGTFPCNQLAAEFFNGGGHLNASGGEFFGTMEEAKAVFEKALEKYKPLLTAKS